MKKYNLIFILFALFLFQCNIQENRKKPNFLVILTDDQTYRAIGYNNELVKTPNLDKLANDGIIFNRVYIATPVCAASRASLLTGLYPQTNGTVALDTKSFIRNVVKDKKYQTLPEILSETGYSTWFCGKSHLGPPRHYGFQFGIDSIDYVDKNTFQDASGFVKKIAANANKRPFFLWVAANQPHIPLNPEQKWLDIYADVEIPLERNFREQPLTESFYNQGRPGENLYRDSKVTNNYKNLLAGPPRSPEIVKEFSKAYYAAISHLDYQVGELIKQMDTKGLMENTVVIFLGDNGYFLGNHGLGNKLTMHEESVRIPFFIYWDKLKRKPGRTDALISSIDIFPTILELAGSNIPEIIQGVSLCPVLSGESDRVRDYVVSESVGVWGKLDEGHRMVVQEEWKYMLSDTGEEALFNLNNDPYELNNLIRDEKYKKKVSDLKPRLIEWQQLTGDAKNVPE
jgi:arylsulfatase A-like enzyme